MITIFRRIRQQLLAQNKLSKYIFYAIGEIFLVVIGILIALQINNWNEKKNLTQKNNAIIQNLNEEFEENATELNNDIKRLDSVNIALRKVLELTSNEYTKTSQKDFEILLNKTFTTPTWSPSSFVLLELKNSGALSNLDNNNLKKLLFKWERKFSKMKVIESQYDLYAREYIEFIVKYGSVRNLDAISGVIPGLKKSSIANNPISFLQNPEFENRVENFYFLAFRLNRDYKSLYALMRDIIIITKNHD